VRENDDYQVFSLLFKHTLFLTSIKAMQRNNPEISFPKDKSLGCLKKRDGVSLYRRGGGCSRLAAVEEYEGPPRIPEANPSPLHQVNQYLASLKGLEETMGEGELLAFPATPAGPPREELEGAALEADERRLLSQDGFDESRAGRLVDQMDGLMHGHYGHDEFNQPNSHRQLNSEHYTSNPNNVRYDSAYRHEMAPQDTTDLEDMELRCHIYCRSGRSGRRRRKNPTPKPYSVAPLVKAPGEY
jgi:hypothetical protein